MEKSKSEIELNEYYKQMAMTAVQGETALTEACEEAALKLQIAQNFCFLRRLGADAVRVFFKCGCPVLPAAILRLEIDRLAVSEGPFARQKFKNLSELHAAFSRFHIVRKTKEVNKMRVKGYCLEDFLEYIPDLDLPGID
ncbi:MAG TPA: hypothetical protein DCG57_15290 [Candidatus Riflebacteria bacterium]|nr:hypothetical protein [Candidatus Riflebacteria bacterium]